MPDFAEVVEKAWDLKCPNSDPVQIWQCKIRNLRRKNKGWNRNRGAEMRKSKNSLMQEKDILEANAESRPLSEAENDRRKEVSLKFEQFWRIEEIKEDKGLERERLKREIEILLIFLLRLIKGEGRK
jgi:hypothetical protein